MDLKRENIIFINRTENETNRNHKFFEKIIEFKKDIINETIISVQTYKRLDIIGVSELNNCISTLENFTLS